MIKSQIKSVSKSLILSYSQIFFSDGKLLGFALLLVSFFNFSAGLSGVLAIASSNGIAFLLGLNRSKITNGLYGFNSLLVGLGLGIYYQLNGPLLLLIIFASVLTLFITIVIEAGFAKYGLPFLSLPFLFGIWIASLASRHYAALEISEAGIYIYNDMVLLGGNDLLQTHILLQKFYLPPSLGLYFVSLGAIFFQYNVYAGILIAIALLFNSRISFTLSLLGFYSAYYYYQFIGANLGELNYGFIGFNFILTSIAIGGFFIIPSIYSYIIVILLVPILSLLVTGTSDILSIYQLSTYSLAFNVVVISFLLVLKYRERNLRKPELVSLQQFSPEKNLYANLNFYKRFGDKLQTPIYLPFYGKWSVNQGHKGKYTHKEDWQHAWDFVIEEDGIEYQGDGSMVTDFLCYGKPIIAPADGEIVEIIDLYDDNEIGETDTVHNWGNTIIIKHAAYLYSKMSHIKKESFKVSKGQYIRKGEAIAQVGNSGRSPFPHLHFQIQATPFVGSKTLSYPISSYIKIQNDEFKFMSGEIPILHDVVSNIEIDSGLKQIFKFVPGQEIEWTLSESSGKKSFSNDQLKWVVGLDLYNNTYLYSESTDSYAYFNANETELIFTSYKGNQKDPLYWFYLSSFRILFGYYKGLVVEDDLPVPISEVKILKIIQDFVAPFYIFVRPKFKMSYQSRKQFFEDSELILNSVFEDQVMGKTFRKIEAVFNCFTNTSSTWKVKLGKEQYTFKRLKG